MNISLTPKLEAMIQKKVKSGLYHSASEVVREGLRLLQDHDQLRELRLEQLRREISVGIEQAEKGELVDFDVDKIKAKARKRQKGRR